MSTVIDIDTTVKNRAIRCKVKHGIQSVHNFANQVHKWTRLNSRSDASESLAHQTQV
jgi:hypothetical protein